MPSDPAASGDVGGDTPIASPAAGAALLPAPASAPGSAAVGACMPTSVAGVAASLAEPLVGGPAGELQAPQSNTRTANLANERPRAIESFGIAVSFHLVHQRL